MRYRVVVTIDAPVSIEVEAENVDDALDRAIEEVGTPALCTHCADKIELNDPIQAVEATLIEDES